MELDEIVKKLRLLAPLEQAESWDNVGLLVEPTNPGRISRVFLTNDLTQRVLDEAIAWQAQFIMAYHPPLFSPLKRLTQSDVKQRIIVQAIENRIAIYSPHTAFDALHGGVNDWLASGLGEIEGARALSPAYELGISEAFKIVVFVPETAVENLRSELANIGLGHIGDRSQVSFAVRGTATYKGKGAEPPAPVGSVERVALVRLEMSCPKVLLPKAMETVKKHHPDYDPSWEVHALAPKPLPATGVGRLITLRGSVPIAELVGRIKSHLQMSHVRLALAHNLNGNAMADAKTVAVCAGSGGTVLKGVRADVYLTGEMSHHDVLAAVESGSSVILVEHSNSERGFLKEFRKLLFTVLDRDMVTIGISESDADPLVTV